jgi:hypothetical protein
VKSLSEILQPARERGNELEKVIAPMFAVMNVYTDDQANSPSRSLSGAIIWRITRYPQGGGVGGCFKGQAAQRRGLHR